MILASLIVVSALCAACSTPPTPDARLEQLVAAAVFESAEPHTSGRLDPTRFDPYLRVHSPNQGLKLESIVDLASVKGSAGLGDFFQHDVLILLDESSSTLAATGKDLDGDGVVGYSRPADYRTTILASHTTDLGDSIIQAELAAARALLEKLDPESTRVGLITFSASARVRAPLGTPAQALKALDAYEVFVDQSGTSIGDALIAAVEQFAATPSDGQRRQRSVLLLSDGIPTIPTVPEGNLAALRVADHLKDLGVAVHAYALGGDVLEDPETFQRIAETTGGTFVAVEDPVDVVTDLPYVRLTGLEAVSFKNRATGGTGRAIRILPDGFFDGFVELKPGRNPIEIVATMENGRRMTETRTVFFRRPAKPSPKHRAAAQEFQRQLVLRTMETEIIAERRRALAQKRLELEVEGDGG